MDGKVIIGTELDTKGFEAEIKQAEGKLNDLKGTLQMADKDKTLFSQSEIIDMEAEVSKLSKKLEVLQGKQAKLESAGLSKFQDSIKNINTGLTRTIKKVGRWALAIFSVRSAYLLVRQVASTISQYNDDLANKLESIKLVMASALEPLITKIVDLVLKLLGYINGLSIAWFGVDLFAKANETSLRKSNKEASELKKTLAGFDEMNVLGSNAQSSSTSANASISPILNSQAMLDSEKKAQDWIKSITYFWENEVWKTMDSITGNFDLFIDGILLTGKGFYDAFKGIIDTIIGLWDMLIGLLTGDTQKLEQGFKQFLNGLLNLVKSVFEIAAGIIMTFFGTIKGVFLSIVDWIYVKIIQPIGNLFKNLWNEITNTAKTAVNNVKNIWNGIIGTFTTIKDKIFGKFTEIGAKAGNIIGEGFKTAINGALRTVESVLNTPINAINKLLNIINKVPGINLGELNTIKLPRLAVGGIVNMPGRGINYGGANIAERGMEGIIPLTDSQQMALLGEAIGKYITVNANITNTMNGRVISRELQKIQSNSDFAMNR